jgi:D-sedoheptulose 7-phosphate isomerase
MSRSKPRPGGPRAAHRVQRQTGARPAAGAQAAVRTQAAVRAYLAQLERCARAVPAAQIARVVEHLWEVARAGGQILIAGNGGSAATASHMALDLGKTTQGRDPRLGGLRVRTIALSDPSVLTAWANDRGYEGVFAEQIATLARPGDAAVLVSVSGNSPNVVAAARAARAAGATVIALLGQPGGAVRALADLAVIVPSEDYGIVEDAHLAINHIVTRCLRQAVESVAPVGIRTRAVSGRIGPRRR